MSNSKNSISQLKTIPKTTFLGLFFATMAEMMGMGILLPILPNIVEGLSGSGTIVGVVFACFALARGIFGPLFGRISDQYGRKNMLLAGLSIYALLSVGFIYALDYLWLIALLWFLQGMASAMVTPIAQSYIGDRTPEGKEGRIMNLFFLGQFGGVAIGPVIGGYLVDNYSEASPFFVMGITALIGLLLVALVVPKTQKTKRGTHKKMKLRRSFWQVLKDRKMKGILIYIVGRGFYRWGFNTMFPIYAITIATLSQYQIGLVISCYMVSGALLQYPFGWLSDRLAKYRAELVLVGGVVAAATTFFIPTLTNLIWLMVLTTLMGMFSAASRASTVAIRTERGRVHGMGVVTGVFMTGFSVGQVLGPVGFGAITDIFSISTSFYLGAFAGLITTLLAYWYLRKPKDRDKT